jgi:hypothetical protein
MDIQYVERVKKLAQDESQSCHHPFRVQLSQGHPDTCTCIQSGYERNTCGACVKCRICHTQWKPESMTAHATHGPKGDYEKFPDVYIADVFFKPWFTRQPGGTALIGPYDFKHGCAKLVMTEDESLAGLDALEAEFPLMRAWIGLYPIHIALYARWIRMASRLGEWMSRRSLYFTAGGPYCEMSQTLTRYDINSTYLYCQGNRVDKPIEALEGSWNLPYFLHVRDAFCVSVGLTNPDMYITTWLGELPTGAVREFTELFGRIWASNTRHWAMLEGECFYYYAPRNVLGRVAHTYDGQRITQLKHWHNYDMRARSSHSVRTSSGCGLCRSAGTGVGDSGRDWPPGIYERVLAYADRVRRRRLWGVLFCAARLLPKARAVRYVPGIGSAYKKAAAEFAIGQRLLLV